MKLTPDYLMSDAVSDEHAVVLAFEDADVADVAMPGAWGRHSFTHHAQFPRVVLKTV